MIETISIAKALKTTDRLVAIDAIVTAPATLLDSTGRRIVVQDKTGAVEVYLPSGTQAPPVGTRIRVEGKVGVAYGAPRFRAEQVASKGTGAAPAALTLHGSPGDSHEWRLVAVSGRVESVHKLGDRWRAELVVGTQSVAVVGQAGAGIQSTTLSAGQTATVVGIARRPYPSASDQRFSVVPRFPADVKVSGVAGGGSATGTSSGTGSSSTAGGGAGSRGCDRWARLGRGLRSGRSGGSDRRRRRHRRSRREYRSPCARRRPRG